jgi:hypothetical protein
MNPLQASLRLGQYYSRVGGWDPADLYNASVEGAWVVVGGALPTGMVLAPSSAYTPAYSRWNISGTPTAIGKYQATLLFLPAGQEEAVRQSFYSGLRAGLGVVDCDLAVYGAPIIATGSFSFIPGGENPYFLLEASDLNNRPVSTWAARSLPRGLTIDAISGSIYQDPSYTGALGVGSYNISITASGVGGSTVKNVTLRVLGVPIISSASSGNAPLFYGKVGVPAGAAVGTRVASIWALTMIDAVNRPVDRWELHPDDSLPDGLSFDASTGVFSGTPLRKQEWTSAGGAFSLIGPRVRAVGPAGEGAYVYVGFSIAAGEPILPDQVISGVVGAFRARAVLEDAGNRPVTRYVAAGLPANWRAVIDSISGWITAPGALVTSGELPKFQLTVSGPGGSATRELRLQVLAGPPTIIAGQSFVGKVGVAFAGMIAVENAVDTGLLWRAIGLPDGIAIDQASGEVSGTPSSAGAFEAVVTVSGGGSESSVAVNFQIAQGAPVLAPMVVGAVADQDLEYALNGEDEANRPVEEWVLSGRSEATSDAVVAGLDLPYRIAGEGGRFIYSARIDGIEVGRLYYESGRWNYDDFSDLTEIVQSELTEAQFPWLAQWSGIEVLRGDAVLPVGVVLEGNIISGVPEVPGTYEISVLARGGGEEVAGTLRIVVSLGPPVVAPGQIFVARRGILFDVVVELLSASERPAVAWSAEGLPAGLSINDEGRIIGEVNAPKGVVAVSVAARGEGGVEGAAETVFIDVRVGSPAVSAGAKLAFSFMVGEDFEFAVPVEDAQTWELLGAVPSGLRIDARGVISGVVGRIGVWAFGVRATNELGSVGVEISVAFYRSKSSTVTRKVTVNTETWAVVFDDAVGDVAGSFRYGDIVTLDFVFTDALGEVITPDISNIIFAIKGFDTDPTLYKTDYMNYRRLSFMNGDDGALRYVRKHLLTVNLNNSAVLAFLNDAEDDLGTRRNFIGSFKFMINNRYYNIISSRNFVFEITRDTL